MDQAESKSVSGRRSPARERLLDAAEARFNREGYNGAGIDAIIADAGIARMTLYNNFGSKEGLIEAVLERRHDALTQWFESECGKRTSDPAEQIAVFFDVLGDWFESESFNGCMFVRGVGELGLSHPSVRDVARRHKRWYAGFFRARAVEAGLTRADDLGQELLLLVEGATACAMVSGNGREEANRARLIAERLAASG
jgi:AcrR family transcriptional regulator